MSESQRSKPRRCRVCDVEMKLTAREMREHYKQEHTAEERQLATRTGERPMSLIEQMLHARRGGAV